MKKKILALCLLVGTLAAAAVSGTLAYFTDTAEETNVMIVGDIDITLWEDNGNPGDDGYASNGGENGKDAVKDDPYDKWLGQQAVFPGVHVAKNVWVENVGDHDAFVRLVITFPAGLLPVWNTDAVDETGSKDWKLTASEIKDTEGKPVQTVYCVEYQKPLSGKIAWDAGNPGETREFAYTSDALLAVTIAPFANYGDGIFTQSMNPLNVVVTAQAIQAAGFASAAHAFSQFDAQDIYENSVKVSTADELTAALAEGKNAVMTGDIETEAATPAPYGNKYAFKLDGGVIDGGGSELHMECYGDDYGIMTSGGTIKNLTVQEGCRAIMIMYPTEDIILDNVEIGGDGVLYPINTGEAGAAGVDLIVTNSTLAGWTSYGNIESASFTNCKFEQGTYYGISIYGRVVKPYVKTEFENCDFVEHMNVDLSSLAEGQKITFTGCNVDGQVLDASKFTVPTTDAEYDTELITVDLPAWAESVEDCMVFSSSSNP